MRPNEKETRRLGGGRGRRQLVSAVKATADIALSAVVLVSVVVAVVVVAVAVAVLVAVGDDDDKVATIVVGSKLAAS